MARNDPLWFVSELADTLEAVVHARDMV
jgi:hypothetical protein